MGIDVTVLRVFTDEAGQFGNKLGVIHAGAVDPQERPRLAVQLGYPATVFVDPPEAGSTTAHARIYGQRTELPFAGHPALGAAWWLRDRGTPVRTVALPAGVVQADYEHDITAISARSEWAPDVALHPVDSVAALESADPADFPDDIQHYLWTWVDQDSGSVRARMFAGAVGVAEEEATGSAAIRLTHYLSRDLTIVQGNGSLIQTRWNSQGWVRLAGRVTRDATMSLV